MLVLLRKALVSDRVNEVNCLLVFVLWLIIHVCLCTHMVLLFLWKANETRILLIVVYKIQTYYINEPVRELVHEVIHELLTYVSINSCFVRCFCLFLFTYFRLKLSWTICKCSLSICEPFVNVRKYGAKFFLQSTIHHN